MSKLNKIDPRLSGEYQRKVSDFVYREVKTCCSILISDLSNNAQYQDDLLDILYQVPEPTEEDYEYAASQAGWEQFTDKYGVNCFRDKNDGQTWTAATWENLCKDQNIDCDIDPIQALEHWIVSDWLADKLADRGEMVTKDFLGLTIWGRTCSGQAISLDNVICDIYDSIQKVKP